MKDGMSRPDRFTIGGMDLGLHVATSPGPAARPPWPTTCARIAMTAEDVGFTKLSVMDHVWQIGMIGPPEHEMLEAYTTLGYLAARTERVELLAWVTAVVYREPGLLAKAVTTLDVLSGGRAWLGIGAAWNEEESRGLGLPFPPHGRAVRAAGGGAADLPADVERRRRALRRHALPARRTLNSPQSLQRPHPPILIGGGGEKKTLRLVAQYAAGVQPVRQPGARAQARRAARALRRRRPRLRRDREDRDGAPRPRPRRRADGEVLEQLATRRSRRQHMHTGLRWPAACTRSSCSARRSSPRPRSCRPRRILLGEWMNSGLGGWSTRCVTVASTLICASGGHQLGVRVLLSGGREADWDTDGTAGLEALVMRDGMLVGFVPEIEGSEDFDEAQVVDAIARTDYDQPIAGSERSRRRPRPRCPGWAVSSAVSSTASATARPLDVNGASKWRSLYHYRRAVRNVDHCE